MLNKSFAEMMAVDVHPYIKKRDGADYLPWGECQRLLVEHGAEVVTFDAVPGPDGSTLRKSDAAFTDKNGVSNRCYEVMVHIRVDNIEWDITHPVLNGNNPVKDNSMNQLRVNNAIHRAFVKGVAKRLGLGFSLWLKEDFSDDFDDLSRHNIFRVKERIEQKITAQMQKGKDLDDVLSACGLNDRTFRKLMSMFPLVDQFERSLG